MAFHHQLTVDFPLDLAGDVAVASGAVVDLSGVQDKGYEVVRDAGAGFTAVLEGSVAELNWTTIANLNASASGAVPAQYNYVRITASVAGVLGATTELKVAGKEN